MLFLTWFLVFVLTLALAALLWLLVRAHRTINRYEESARALVPAYVDATLSLSDAQRNMALVLASIPQSKPEDIDEHVAQALAVVHPTPQFAPVVPLRTERGSN